MTRWLWPDEVSLGLVAGFGLDLLLGDPRRGHPVAGFGRLAGALEARVYAPTRGRGLVAETLLVGGVTGLGLTASRLPPWTRVPLTAAVTWMVLGGRSLATEGTAVGSLLAADDLVAARVRVRNLVGRDTTRLDADGVARACVESLAENSSDAVVAPLLWGAVGGVPGLLAYRAVNTLDAMVGHRSERYAQYGWAAARLDDLANWAPARLTVLLTAGLAGPSTFGSVLRTVRRDAPAHPSPNAGPVEAAWAAALGVHLGGTNTYAGAQEDRGRLGDGPGARPTDIDRAVRLLVRLSSAALAVTVAGRVLIRSLRSSRR